MTLCFFITSQFSSLSVGAAGTRHAELQDSCMGIRKVDGMGLLNVINILKVLSVKSRHD